MELGNLTQNESFDVLTFFKKKKADASYLRYNFEKIWYRNILFYIGKQWIKYDSTKRVWTKVDLPSWFPTPITNKYASTIDAIASVLHEVKPEIIATPASTDPKDIASADIARIIIDICKEESGFEKEEEKAISWFLNTGNVFYYTYYDNSDKWGVVEVEKYRCLNCGFTDTLDKFVDNNCPSCGNPTFEKTGEKAVFPKGKITTIALSPFEVFVDMNVKDFEDQEYVLIAKTLPEDVAKQRWANIKPETDGSNIGMQFFNSLSYITNTSDAQFQGVGQFYAANSKLVTVWELFIKPRPELPNGWHGFICNNEILEGGDIEYIGPDGKPYIPIVHIPCIDVPKRFWAKTIADDLVHKQMQRNKLESFIQLAAHRTSNPVWLVPNTAGVEKITGEPGEIIRFNDSNTAHGVPTRLPGVELTQSIFRWLEKIDSDFEELASTYDIVKGNVPPNVPTLGGLELLKERGMSRFNRMIKNMERGKLKVAYHWLWIWKQFCTESRQMVIKDANGKWKEKSFNNSDLTGNVTLRIEPGSSNPRSEGYKQYIAGQLLGYGLIDITDVFAKYKLLKTFHADEFIETFAQDIEYAQKEEQRLLDENPILPFLREEIDNHLVHVSSHIKFAKTEQFMRLPIDIQERFEEHIKQHKQLMVNQMQNQQMVESGKTEQIPQSSGDLMNLLSAKGGSKSGVETSQIENEGGL